VACVVILAYFAIWDMPLGDFYRTALGHYSFRPNLLPAVFEAQKSTYSLVIFNERLFNNKIHFNYFPFKIEFVECGLVASLTY